MRRQSRCALISRLVPVVLAVIAAGCDSSGGKPGSSAGTSGGGGASGGSASTSGDYSGLSGSIEIDGSSTVAPVSEAVAEEFQIATNRQVSVVVGTAGTGGGFKRFARGEIDVADASRPILKEEMEAAAKAGIEYIELPVCFDALTVAVHPSNPLSSITVAQLKSMWEPAAQKKITRWNQVNPDWPDEELALYGAGSDSGTWDYFTEAVVGKAKQSRGDYTASEDDNVLVQGIAGNKHALGFLPYSYYDQNKSRLKALAVDWEKGAGPVAPSLETVLQGTYNPLSRPLFIYVKKQSAERPEVKAFVQFYLTNVREYLTEVKYLPLPDQAYVMAEERFEKLESGTGFGGAPAVGLPVEEILKRPPVK